MKHPTGPDTSLLPVLWFRSLQCDIRTLVPPRLPCSVSLLSVQWGLIWRCQESSFPRKHIKEWERGSLFSQVHIIQTGKLASRGPTSRQPLPMTCRRRAGKMEMSFCRHSRQHPVGNHSLEKGLKDETQCRDNTACFSSRNVFTLGRRPPPKPPALWCTKTGAWALFVNTWNYVALIKIHKQAKSKFSCSLQPNVSLISLSFGGLQEYFWVYK